MRTAGIDAATRTGLALVGDGEDRGKAVVLPRERGHLRLQLIASEVAKTLRVWQPTFVAIEGYAYCRNIKSFITLVEVGTVIRAEVYKLRLPWIEVPPMVLKKWTTGSGIASKAQMALSVQERWGYTSPSHDIVDAYALAQFAQMGREAALAVTGISLG